MKARILMGSKNFEGLGSSVALLRPEIQAGVEIRILKYEYCGSYLQIIRRIEVLSKTEYMQV
jgi:hypothetical protein